MIIKEKLRLSAMVCVYDEAIFAKAVEIQFKEKKTSFVLVMGGFHTLMMFLGVTGTRFEDAGHQDILIPSAVLSDEFAEQLMTGSL